MISRPRFWIYELGPYIVGIIAAGSIDQWGWLFPTMIIFFIFFTYPANIYIYGINDIYDYETDLLNPKKVAYESLVLPEERRPLLRHIAYVTVPFLIYSFFTVSLYSFLAIVAFFFFAGFYSAKPIRAKTVPILDTLFSAGHYVATAAFSYLFVLGALQTTITWSVFLPCILAGMLWAMAMHAYSAVPDIVADSDAKLSTVATLLKKNKTLYLCAFLYAFSALLSFPYLGIISIVLGILYISFMLVSLFTNENQLFKIYTFFPTINTLSGMIVFFTILLSKL